MIIGCPCKNDLKVMKLMLESLLDSTKYYNKIIFIDGGSKDGTIEFLRYLMIENKHIELIELNSKTPLEAYNKLFEIALEMKEDLLLTQTDVLFPKVYNRDWLYEMYLSGESEEIGAVIPLNGHGISGPDYVDGMAWLGGWCTYLPYRTINILKGYDKSFPNGFGVDVDFTYRLFKEGLKIRQINYWVDHHMANSREHDNSEDAEKMKQESAEYFRRKWKVGEFA